MQSVVFGRATNRRVLGSMNDFAFQASVHLARGDDLPAIAIRFAETPMSAIGPKRWQLGYPQEVARELFAAGAAS